jgi:cytochrome c peroxidase
LTIRSFVTAALAAAGSAAWIAALHAADRVPQGEGSPKSWTWELPPGFPAPVVPPDNPMTAAKVELGRRLFLDTRLSGDGTYSCASCHQPDRTFTDGRSRAVGARGDEHRLATPSLVNAAYNARFGWADPGVTTLEQQTLVPLFNVAPIEMGVAGREDEVLSRFRSSAADVQGFRAAFPDEPEPVTIGNIARALAAYERTLIAATSRWDRWVWFGDREAVDDAVLRGAQLFFSERLACSECHGGFTFSGPVVFVGAPAIEPTYHNTGMAAESLHAGLAESTGRAADRGRFRAPSLRNVARTAPYLHDGSVPTLEALIYFYAAAGRGTGREATNKSDRVRGFHLTPGERSDLVAFLVSLDDQPPSD